MADPFHDYKARGGKVTTTKIEVETVRRKIRSKFDSRCLNCNVPIKKGEEVFWTPGQKGSHCFQCGNQMSLSSKPLADAPDESEDVVSGANDNAVE
jgi:hypothetical protein